MGWGSRLKNGVAAFMSNQQMVAPARDRSHRGPSLNVNEIRGMLEAAPGLSQPVWGPEISTVGAYSREGYTSKTFDTPVISFRAQAQALEIDEDVQLSINHLASKITGGSHYIKAANEELIEYFEEFTNNLEFDIFDTETIKELLWYGNSVYKPRLGIQHVRSADDLMHIPISSFQRIWWDRQRIPYKYEFRGAEYQGYHNPSEVIHFKWNPIDASAFGTGFGVSMTSPRIFEMPTPQGDVQKRLPPLLERKYATQFNMQMGEQRYISRNVWAADGASEDERNALQNQVDNLEVGQDVVAGTKIEVTELGSQSKNFNAEQFMDITQGPIMKAMNDFRGKESGSSGHSYANAKESAILDEIGLAAFPIAIKTQLNEKLFRPWYEAHPMVQMNFLGGMIPVPWEETKFEVQFGEQEKKDIPIEDRIKLIELYKDSDVADPLELVKLFAQAGLGLSKTYDTPEEQMELEMRAAQNKIDNKPDPGGFGGGNGNGNDNSNTNANGNKNNENFQEELAPIFNDMGGGPVYPDFTSGTTSPPNDMAIYNDMMRDVRGKPPNPNQNWDQGDYQA